MTPPNIYSIAKESIIIPCLLSQQRPNMKRWGIFFVCVSHNQIKETVWTSDFIHGGQWRFLFRSW